MMTIRIASKEDIKNILNLLKSVRGDISNFDYRQFLVAVDGERIVGCIRLKQLNDCLELASMAVDIDYRKKGIGTILVKKILQKNLHRPVYLLCFEDTVKFYKNVGFEVIEAECLPDSLKEEYLRVFKKLKKLNLKIIAMKINSK